MTTENHAESPDELSQTERIEQLYHQFKDSPEHDYQRIVYEIPHGMGWSDTEGYTVDGSVGDVPILKVVTEDEAQTIPVSRLIRTHTTEEP